MARNPRYAIAMTRVVLVTGAGCYGLQIDGPRFGQVLVIEFA
jgi:hypothetical protein